MRSLLLVVALLLAAPGARAQFYSCAAPGQLAVSAPSISFFGRRDAQGQLFQSIQTILRPGSVFVLSWRFGAQLLVSAGYSPVPFQFGVDAVGRPCLSSLNPLALLGSFTEGAALTFGGTTYYGVLFEIPNDPLLTGLVFSAQGIIPGRRGFEVSWTSLFVIGP